MATTSNSTNQCVFFPDENCNCDLTLHRFIELLNPPKNPRAFPDCQTTLELILLRSNQFIEKKFDLYKSAVCEVHLKHLCKVKEPKTVKKCTICIPVMKRTFAYKGLNHLQHITKKEAYGLFEIYSVPNSYGDVICHQCSNELQSIIDRKKLFPAEQLMWLSELALQNESEKDDNSSYSVALSTPFSSATKATIKERDAEKRKYLNYLLKLCGCKYSVWVTQSYTNLTDEGKSSFLSRTRAIMKSVLSILAPNDTDLVFEEICHEGDSKYNLVLDGNFIKVMHGVTSAYNNADDWPTRKAILSIVAPKISYRMISSFIPGLTLYRFTSARLHAATMGTGVVNEPNPQTIQRFDNAQVEHFVDFITSSLVCTDLPFGEKIIKLTDGSELFVPDTIRNQIPSRIVQQYYSYCNETCKNFSPLGTSSLFKILDICKASTRRSFAGIDYFNADAGEAFDSIIKMVENLGPQTLKHKNIIDNLKQGRRYLKSEYKVHISTTSTVADHCSTYALSDTKDKSFRAKCDHEHKDQCDDCLMLKNTFLEFEDLVKEIVLDKEDAKRAISKFKLLKESIDAWKAHQLRTVHQDNCRDELLSSLPPDSFYLYCDWAMKFLPAKFRETQNQFFGKRGLSWHISVVVKNNDEYIPLPHSSDDHTSNKYVYKIFVHVFEQCIQDANFVSAIIRDVLLRMKTIDTDLKRCFIRTDNAGCYKSAQTILSFPKISEETAINIERIDFCESQSGKGPCDRYSAIIKAIIKIFVNEKNSVETAAQFVEAALSNGGITGVEVFNCRLQNSINKQKVQLAKIFYRNNFYFDSNGLQVHRAYGIGEGKMYDWKDLKPIKVLSTLQFENNTLPENSVRFSTPSTTLRRNSSKSKEKSKDLPSNLSKDKDGISHAIYECIEEGCVDKFIKFGNYLRHICNGKHSLLPERLCFSDTAALMYKAKLETIEKRKLCSLSLEISRTKAIYDENNEFLPLPEGWALPPERKNVKLSDKQVRYLTERFDEASHKDNPIRWKPETVAAHMRECKTADVFLFSSEEFLKPSQIRSFFSRLSAKRKNLLREEENENADEEAMEEDLSQEVEELAEAVRNRIHTQEEGLLPASTKRALSNSSLNEPKRGSFRRKK